MIDDALRYASSEHPLRCAVLLVSKSKNSFAHDRNVRRFEHLTRGELYTDSARETNQKKKKR